MKKRILAVVLGLCAVISATGCSKKLSNDVMTIEQYKGLEVEKVEVSEVVENDIIKSISDSFKAIEKYGEITDRTVQPGDTIILDYSGKVDGVVFEGGTAQDQELEIWSGKMIPGFEEAIIGHKLGETFDINVTFPTTYGEQTLAGKDAVFTITIDKITGAPQLTVESLADLKVEEKTVEEYKERVRKDLETSNQQAADSQLESKAWEALIAQCKIEDYPEEKYNEVITQIDNQYNYLATQYGMTVDQLVKAYFGVTRDEMAKQLIKQEYAVEIISKKEKMEVSEKEYEKRLEELATQYGYKTPEEMEKAVGKENLEKSMIQEQVAKFLVENCKQVEKKADKDK